MATGLALTTGCLGIEGTDVSTGQDVTASGTGGNGDSYEAGDNWTGTPDPTGPDEGTTRTEESDGGDSTGGLDLDTSGSGSTGTTGETDGTDSTDGTDGTDTDDTTTGSDTEDTGETTTGAADEGGSR